jgi:hypothetical protein
MFEKASNVKNELKTDVDSQTEPEEVHWGFVY